MEEEKEREEIREAIQLLLENRWLPRQQRPEEYFLVRRHEKKLRDYFRDKCGWPLLVNARYYKLEKIPAEPRPFMGLEEMQSPEDYALLCCVLAYLEEQEVEGMFLLGGLCEALLDFYPGDGVAGPLKWESYNWRKALIRVMNFLLSEGVLQVIEDESEAFLKKGRLPDGMYAGEALYEVTPLARVFLRSFPKSFQGVSVEELCVMTLNQGQREEVQQGEVRRRRVYRQLLLQPACYRCAENETDFVYLRNMQRRLREELEERTGLMLELYHDTAMLVSHERPSWFRDIFPVRMRGLHDLILHFATQVRSGLAEDGGKMPVWTEAEFQEQLERLKAGTGSGWTKEYRDMTMKHLAEVLLAELCAWNMAAVDEDGLIHMKSALLRLCGNYPSDYQAVSVLNGENK